MSYQAAVGLTRVQQERIDAENAEAAFSPYNMFGPDSYGVPRVVPPSLSTVAARGATWEGCSFFIWLSMERNRQWRDED